MTAFRIIDQAPQFFSADGTFLLVGGTVTFYQSGTTTLQNTYTDATLTTANNNPLTINSQGRTSDIWGSGNYRIVVADSTGAVQYTRDNVEIPGGTGQTIPSLVANEFLTTDGVNLLWEAIAQVPSSSGQSGKFLTNNGESLLWGSLSVPNPAITVTQTSSGVTITGGSGVSGSPIFMIQCGSGSAPASGNVSTSQSVTFPTAFTALPIVSLTTSTNTAASAGIPIAAPTSISTTGFGAFFNNAVNASAGGSIIGPVAYTWIAIGLKGTF